MDATDFLIGAAAAALVYLVVSRRMRAEKAAHDAWVARAGRTTGVIERIRSVEGEGLDEYTPVITYRVKGLAYSIDGERSTDKPEVGTEIEVAYDPALPSSARVVAIPAWTGYDRRMAAVLALGFALIVAFVSSLIR